MLFFAHCCTREFQGCATQVLAQQGQKPTPFPRMPQHTEDEQSILSTVTLVNRYTYDFLVSRHFAIIVCVHKLLHTGSECTTVSYLD